MSDIFQLYRDYSIPIPVRKNKHYRDGWLQTRCPFCGGNRYHLGYNLSGGYFNCWRCGWKPFKLTISLLLGMSEKDTAGILKNYRFVLGRSTAKRNQTVPHKVIYTPKNLKPLNPVFRQYLEGRKFDPDKIIHEWDIQAIYPWSDPGWAWRIFIPYYFEGELVAYQGRSISKNNQFPYMASSQEHGIMDVKNMLYGLDKVYGDSVVVVEGITDAWRLGPGAVATSGDMLKPSQRILLHRFKRVFIFGDEDNEDSGHAGQKASKKMANQLSGVAGLEVFRIRLKYHGDPGNMNQEDADYLMRDLGFR